MCELTGDYCSALWVQFVTFPLSYANPLDVYRYLWSLLFSLKGRAALTLDKYLPEKLCPSPKPLLSAAQTMRAHKGLEKLHASTDSHTRISEHRAAVYLDVKGGLCKCHSVTVKVVISGYDMIMFLHETREFFLFTVS